MTPGDVVTIGAPFGNETDQFVVSGVIDDETSYVWSGAEHLAISNAYLTKVGAGGEYPVPPSDDSEWWVTVGAFRSRFSHEEKVAIELASLDDPASSKEVRAKAAAIRAAEKDAQASQYINLRDERTIAGVRAYESFGLIASADKILLTKPTEKERYFA